LTTLHVQNVSISYITHPYIGEEKRENIEQNNREEIRIRAKERDRHNGYIYEGRYQSRYTLSLSLDALPSVFTSRKQKKGETNNNKKKRKKKKKDTVTKKKRKR
jgi:hypothetical protein